MQLMKHQKAGVNFALKNAGVAAFYYEVGTGKTITALATYAALKEKNMALKLLVICPLSLIEGAWIKEIEKNFPQFTWFNMHARNCNAGRVDPMLCDIWIVNFEYLISVKKYGELHRSLALGSWMCVIDESSKMKNHKAVTTQRIVDLAPLFRHRIIMSGTPAPNIEWEYFSQMRFLSKTIFGDNFFKFRNIFFRLARGKQIMPGQFMNKAALREMLKTGFKYELDPGKRQGLMDAMRPFVQFVKARECIDLPDEIDEFRVIEMNPEHRSYYNKMKEEYILELKGQTPQDPSTYAVANVALTKLMKLRQITSGFAIDEAGDPIALMTLKTSAKVNPKLDVLLDLIEECGQEQMIIWCQFHWEINEIRAALADLGGISELHGDVPMDARIDEINNFLEGKTRFLLAHPHSAGHGLTFVNCHLQVFFSLSYSFEEYTQARGRTMRYGQKNNCVYFHLICKNTIDEDVLAILQRKDDAAGIVERYLGRSRL